MKIKTAINDFIVEEIAELPIKNGGFGLYRLRKKGLNTAELLLYLSKQLHLPFKKFAYGGRKDKYATTSQYITIEAPKIFTLNKENFSLEFLGFIDRPMGPDLISANKFLITVRDLTPEETIRAKEEIGQASLTGYPNYFDDQRFGSYVPEYGFIAEKILKRHFNGALKIYLAVSYPEERNDRKKRKLYFMQNWAKWARCLAQAKTAYEKKAFGHLINNPGGFLEPLKRIPADELSFQFSSYQSYLWNEALRRLLASKIKESLFVHRGKAGDYLFYRELDLNIFNALNGLFLPLACSKMSFPDAETQGIYTQILTECGIKVSAFNNIKTRQAFFGCQNRKALIAPQDVMFSQDKDELNPGKEKLTLEFKLSRGSFATMFLKRVFT